MNPAFKPYLYSAIGFMMALYLLAFVFLALLTAINQAADYPLYNFLGSEQDLGQVVLQLLPAQNPYYLQKWSSLPAVSTIISALMLVGNLIVTFKFARQVKARGGFQALAFAFLVLGVASVIFADMYSAIAAFLAALANLG